MSLLQKILSNSVAVLSTSVGRIILLSILARNLEQNEFGQYSLLIWFGELFLLLTNLGINGEFNKYIPELRKSGDVSFYIIKRLILILKSTLIGIGLFYILYFNVSYIHDMLKGINVVYYVIYLITYSFAMSFRAYMKGYERYKQLSLIELLFLLSVLALTIYFKNDLDLYLILIILSILNVFLILYYFHAVISEYKGEVIKKSCQLPKTRNYTQYIYATGIVSFFVWSRTEIYFVSKINFSSVAIYSVAITISGVIYQITNLCSSVLLPHFSGITSQKRISENTKVTKWLLVIMAIIGITSIPNINLFIDLLFGKEYYSAESITIVLIIGSFSMICSSSSNYLLSIGLSNINFCLNLIAAFALLFLCQLSYKSFGLMGISISKATVIWFISFSTFYICYLKKGLIIDHELVVCMTVFFVSLIAASYLTVITDSKLLKLILSVLGLATTLLIYKLLNINIINKVEK
ncbi:hypothetical protein BCS93_08850 [Vibrio breoganii]|uniref:Polysaccharide biosynthesis protein C-terminal domain-containing protein n=1 Tax=Vibrio breoganii TaxID=553239 RepID=A0AAP8SX45_9VIBR|nr:lipopolysaccharide biosynthesis protein [Vibrio breoganii]PMP11310.1 hypothetical protein BCS93_08850 [Vibrio breoganii]